MEQSGRGVMLTAHLF